MKQRSGDIHRAYVPNFRIGLQQVQVSGDTMQAVSSRIHEILILGSNGSDYYGLLVTPGETSESYFPLKEGGFINPFHIYHVSRRHLRSYVGSISSTDFREVKKFTKSLYRLCVQQWCNNVFFAHVPMSVCCDQNRFIVKKRPTIMLGPGAYISLMTNGGEYTAPGPIIDTQNIPGKVDDFPIFLPDNLLDKKQRFSLIPRDRARVQEYVTRQISDLLKYG